MSCGIGSDMIHASGLGYIPRAVAGCQGKTRLLIPAIVGSDLLTKNWALVTPSTDVSPVAEATNSHPIVGKAPSRRVFVGLVVERRAMKCLTCEYWHAQLSPVKSDQAGPVHQCSVRIG